MGWALARWPAPPADPCLLPEDTLGCCTGAEDGWTEAGVDAGAGAEVAAVPPEAVGRPEKRRVPVAGGTLPVGFRNASAASAGLVREAGALAAAFVTGATGTFEEVVAATTSRVTCVGVARA